MEILAKFRKLGEIPISLAMRTDKRTRRKSIVSLRYECPV